MALAHPVTSQAFTDDQTPLWRAWYFDTTSTAVRVGPGVAEDDRYTAFGSGLEYAQFDLLTSSFAPTTTAAIEAALQRTSGITRSVLGYAQNDAYRTGVVPSLYEYWGAGAPSGGARPKQTLLKVTGYVQRAGAATLVFAGQGYVHAVVTRGGTETLLAHGPIREPSPTADVTRVTPAIIRDEWGYQFNEVPFTFAVGDRLTVYVWHNGEPWGGVACKVVPGAVTTTSDAFLSQVRDAGVLGASFCAKEAAPIAAVDLPYLISAQKRVATGGVTELQLEVALTVDEQTGYRIDRAHDTYDLRDNAFGSKLAVRKGRVVHFEGGFRAPDGAEELYARFTGVIDDITPSEDGETATIVCRSLESKLTTVNDENLPDRLSYHAHGYVLRERSSDPVFGIPAYDSWPIELAVIDMALRAGVDSYNLGRTPGLANDPAGRRHFVDAATGFDFFGAPHLAVRNLANADTRVTLERQANYGNVPPLQKDYLPKDDAYLFNPEVAQTLYDRAHTILEQYGYDFSTTPTGQLAVTGRNNPTYFQSLAQDGVYGGGLTEADPRVSVAAVGGVVFQRLNGQSWSRTVQGHFSRADLYVGVGADTNGRNGGRISVTVERHLPGDVWETVRSFAVDTAVDAPEGFFYDNVAREDGSNACVFPLCSLPFDEYRITLAPLGPSSGAADCVYRLNGVAIFERDPEQSYPVDKKGAARPFTTLDNLYTIRPESNYKDLRNHTIVVGGRKATITDSAKAQQQNNPNNAEYEFHVAVAVDPFSIYDPTAPNFVGQKRMTVVVNDKITDGEFARWLARTILLQYRHPKTSAQFTHSALPMLELRDAMLVFEERNRAVEHTLWVTGYTEHWTLEDATVDVDAEAFPALPSFQPREDIDVDRLFDDDGDGKGEPIINLRIDYQNVYGRPVTNADLADATAIRGFTARQNFLAPSAGNDPVTNATAMTLSHPAIPGTIRLVRIPSTPLDDSLFIAGFNLNPATTVLVNNPYRQFFAISGWNGSFCPTLQFTWQEGDGTPGVYDKAHYGFPSGPDGTWAVAYDYLVPRTKSVGVPAENPFYDPYTSEIGNVVRVRFDALRSARYRVSVWDATRKDGRETPVAWLTAPGSDPEEPEAHWVYLESGPDKEFTFDGVDNIGFWNTIQSQAYAEELKGAFGDKPLAVSRGFYAWNDVATDQFTLVGDATTYGATTPNFHPTTHEPYYTIGQYSQFYVKVEVWDDELIRRDLSADGRAEPRTVNSTDLPRAGTWHPTSEVYVWQHLGAPTQVGVRIQEWRGTGLWTPGRQTTEADWGVGIYATPRDAQATIQQGRPVRLTFVPEPRKGPMFRDAAGVFDPASVSVKLTRQVHLKTTVFDQFYTFAGKPWQNVHASRSANGAEQKRVTSRMYHNEDHTLEFEDGAWRTGDTLTAYEWVFDPSHFRKDFGNGIPEALRYGDYEQLEALPNAVKQREGGVTSGARDYLTLAYLAYLFYFSALTLDRSGRRQWCLDSWLDALGNRRGFIDKSKIVTPTWLAATDTGTPSAVVRHEALLSERYLKRSIFVRQWVEPGWADGTFAGSPVSRFNISAAEQRAFVQLAARDFDPRRGVLSGLPDDWLAMYKTPQSAVNKAILLKATIEQNAPTVPGDLNVNIRPAAFGTWDFQSAPFNDLFRPSPGRDFHPFWRYPAMPDFAGFQLNEYPRFVADELGGAGIHNRLDLLMSSASQVTAALRDPAREELWYGYAYSEALLGGDAKRGALLEMSVEGALALDAKAWALPDNDIPYLFDYAKQDQLDRFDLFRGVISRAPYGDPNAPETANYRGSDKKRAASAQPVKPSGAYLVNLARYEAYTLAPVHSRVTDPRVHFCDGVTDWFDLRFRHEYVWYSSNHFPVAPNGAAVYQFTQQELTRITATAGVPWWASLGGLTGTDELRFDPGAWTGWKDDVPAATWTTTPHLRWREVRTTAREPVAANPENAGHSNVGGGFNGAWGGQPTGDGPVNEEWLHSGVNGSDAAVYRVNVFDTEESSALGPRLAVGPETPESRPVVMSLVLPSRLRQP
jgi:hypothetical protein